MKIHIVVSWTSILLLIPSAKYAQDWVSRYNGAFNSSDYAYAIAVDAAGNVYVTGHSMGSNYRYDYATVKYDSAGAEQWVVRYNGPGNSHDKAYAIAVDASGNVYVTGESVGLGLFYDYATVKYDSAGVEQWVARYNGSDNDHDCATAIAIDNLGYIYVTGLSHELNTGDDYTTVKYNTAGVEQWVAQYDGPGDGSDRACAIAIDAEGNVYVTGGSEGSGTAYDYATVKYNSLGEEQWVARYNYESNGTDNASGIVVDNMSNVYVTGRSSSMTTGVDYATVKYDSVGIEQWVARYNGLDSMSTDRAEAITIDNVGNVYVTGWSYSSVSNDDYATVKYDSTGVEQWVTRYNGSGDFYDRAEAIALDGLGNVYVTGHSCGQSTLHDYATIKYDSEGIEEWVARYDGPGNNNDFAYAMVVDSIGYIYVTGRSVGIGTADDYATLKYPSDYGIAEKPIYEIHNRECSDATVFNGPLRLPDGKDVKVFNVMGRQIHTIDPAPGIYFIEVDGKITRKVIKVR